MSHAFLWRRNVFRPTVLCVKLEDFASGRIQPALPFRGTPEEEEKRRRAEALKAEAEAFENKRAGRVKTARREAEVDFYEAKYADQYQQTMKNSSREAREAQLKIEFEQSMIQEEENRQMRENERMQMAFDAQEKSDSKRKSLLSDLEKVRQMREGKQREEKKNRDLEIKRAENMYDKEMKMELTDVDEKIRMQQVDIKNSGSRSATSTTAESERNTSAAMTSANRVAKSNLPLFSLPATAIVGGILALRNRERLQKEVENQLQTTVQRKKEINDYGNLALVCRKSCCIQNKVSSPLTLWQLSCRYCLELR